MYSPWPRSSRTVPVLGKSTTNLEFVRALRSPCLLSAEFSRNFATNQFLSDYVDETGYRPLDLAKFLNFFDCNHSVTVEEWPNDVDDQIYRQTSLGNFVRQLEEGGETGTYLKDWHAQKEFNMPSTLYEDHLPFFMKMDWINNESWTTAADNPLKGDYRFIYIGARGSRTMLHYDVFRSFSWSLNVAGFKHWLILPIERTQEFFRKFPDANDLRICPDVVEQFGLIEAVQAPGQIMLMPPGWYHQVLNLSICMSINHNTINAFNVMGTFYELQERHSAVLKELDDQRDLRDDAEFEETVELVLNTDYRITNQVLSDLAQRVVQSRLVCLEGHPLLEGDPPDVIRNTDFWTHGDLNIVAAVLDSRCGCPDSDRHLLSAHPCDAFIRQMGAVDMFFARTVIRMIEDKREQP